MVVTGVDDEDVGSGIGTGEGAHCGGDVALIDTGVRRSKVLVGLVRTVDEEKLLSVTTATSFW